MVAYEINRKRLSTFKEINRENNIIILEEFIWIPFKIKMHISTLPFTNPRIISDSFELPGFYDF